MRARTQAELSHRLAAILSADVAGYTRLLAEDEAATIRALSEAREAIAGCVSRQRPAVVRARDQPVDLLHVAARPGSIDVVRRTGILTGWLLCGVLDISAACIQAWVQADATPAQVLRGVAAALWGAAAVNGGAGMAAIGLVMHFTVALTATLVFYALSRRIAALRAWPWWLVGPIYGAVVFGAMNYGTLPALSWVRSSYLDTPVRWPGPMGWPQFGIHLVCVGLPIVWGIRRAAPATGS
jgi:hypothetical protein